jgi:hypothetical protein
MAIKLENRGTEDELRARWSEADKALAESRNVMDATHKKVFCIDAAEAATKYVMGE